MTFEEKVRSMTASQLIQAMIDGLNAGYYTVDMGTFGVYREGTCFGCAATHAICHISGARPTFIDLNTTAWHDWAVAVNDGTDVWFFGRIESFFDFLRMGDIDVANEILKGLDMSARIILNPSHLNIPHLSTGNWKIGLAAFQRLADYNRLLEQQTQQQEQ